MHADNSVTALVERLQSGDRAAAQHLWERYYPRLVCLARQRLKGVALRVSDEEDVALSAFDSFCRRAEKGDAPRLDDRDSLWGLLATITARKAADLANYSRRQKRGGGMVRGDSVAASPSSPGPGMDAFADSDETPELAAQLAEEFERLLERLTVRPALRQIALWKMEGYANVEVAEKLGIAEVTVERRLSLIRKILDH